MNAQINAHMVSSFDPMQADMAPLHLALVGAKAVDLDFDDGRLSSDAGLVLRKDIDEQLGFTRYLGAVFSDPREARRVKFTLQDLLTQRVLHMAASYEDANASNTLPDDPIFTLIRDRLPETGAPLASQPTMACFENRVSCRGLSRMARVLLEQFLASYGTPPTVIALAGDDTEDSVHRHQERARYDSY